MNRPNTPSVYCCLYPMLRERQNCYRSRCSQGLSYYSTRPSPWKRLGCDHYKFRQDFDSCQAPQQNTRRGNGNQGRRHHKNQRFRFQDSGKQAPFHLHHHLDFQGSRVPQVGRTLWCQLSPSPTPLRLEKFHLRWVGNTHRQVEHSLLYNWLESQCCLLV